MRIYKEWLSEQGIKFHDTNAGLLFRYQGGGFIIADNRNDKQYLQIIMPNVYEVQTFDKDKAYRIANKLNNEIKSLKVIIQDDDNVWLTVEQFLDDTPNVEDFMERLLNILLRGRLKFQMLMG